MSRFSATRVAFLVALSWLLSLSAGGSAQAADDCAAVLSGSHTISHHGSWFIAAYETYETTISYDSGTQLLSLASNWGPDLFMTLNLSDHGLHFDSKFWGTYSLRCERNDELKPCNYNLKDYFYDRLYAAENYALAADPTQKSVIACARKMAGEFLEAARASCVQSGESPCATENTRRVFVPLVR